MTQTELLKKIADEIGEAQEIGVMGHKRVDGDSAGAVFALYYALKGIGKSPIIFSDKGDESLSFFKDFLVPNYSSSPKRVDLLILLDMGGVVTASVPDAISEAKTNRTKLILIDHHHSGDTKEIVDIALVNDKASSACEVLIDLIKFMNIDIDKALATFLYTGVVSDSGSFQFDSTTEKTLDIGSELIKKGAKREKIVQKTFLEHSTETLKVFGLALNRLYFNPQYDAAITYLTLEDAPILKKNKISVSAIATFLNVIKGVKVIAVFAEEEKGKIKVSLRTNDNNTDLTKLAGLFGGGGHIKASAFSIDGTIVETKDGIKII